MAVLPIANIHIYNSFIENSAAKPLVGAASASYIFYPHALRRLRRYNPDLKIIVMVRSPISRAFSHWNMNRRKGRETRSFATAVADERRRPVLGRARFYFSYLERGLYATQCAALLEIFPREQILFLNAAELGTQRRAVLERVLGFLNAPFDPAVMRVRDQHIGRCRAPPDPASQADLIDYFHDDVRQLEAMFGWDLAAWLTPTPAVRRLETT